MHASLMMEFGGKIIHVDPWSQADFTGLPQADVIIITDVHPDHEDRAAIDKLKKPGTVIIAPKAVAADITEAQTISNGEKKTIAGLDLEAVPMYNLQRGPQPGMLFHDKGRGNGYILTLGGKRIYLAGDTECTAEMKALKNIDVAFIPMNLPYTMPPSEAAECARVFQPKIAYPYHFRDSDPQEFADALKGTGVEVRIRKWY
jgi:L-ascorbate metabolism protein UlaG (beta-lactamase superfamily)